VKAPASFPNPALRGWRFVAGVPGPSLWYWAFRRVFQVAMCAIWKLRVFNRHHEPAAGSAVYICNHQSFLDPMLMSLALRRPMNYMARDTLFRFPVFKQLIASLNAFPVRRATADLAAMKEAMRRLKAGGQVAVFAEGTRTTDGRIGPMLPGVAMLARRVADWTVPVLIDGAFEAWPRTQAIPGPGSVVVQYGRPIPKQEAQKYHAQELLEEVRRTLIEIQTDVRRRVGRPALEY
jgi:1-acyl-sn-glycerol-3-phosphate acyltransferase